MSVKSSISLTDQQDAFVRAQVQSGRYASASAVLQQGLEMLRLKTEAESAEIEALRELLSRRMSGPFVSSEEMDARVQAMIERKRRALDVET
ncbi:MAG: type II toxin-antitoxin system ParD family antitoxin [Devosia sp.]|uniref:type II toxin-antitoxin system ParD family antitoxin n=1 Tax=Devosia sp. TaxID=1871048 RepID=UPI0024CBE754|nr:type II toxin-antitoxin system ParD family antitoxin [Devosia sp.]UYN98811.1 MAG: type II toxin-antitoxin system ParD family antitoxin [Devosia sp.]